MKGYNNPLVPQAVRDALGLQGAFDLPAEESLGFVLQLLDLSESPYVRAGQGVADSKFQAAVAAKKGLVGFYPKGGTILQLRKLLLTNHSAATVAVAVKLTYRATVLALAGWATGAETNMQYSQAFSVADRLTSGCGIIAGVATTVNLGQSSIFTVFVPATSQVELDVPYPGICMYGNDPGGTPILVAYSGTDEAAVQFGAQGREWRLTSVAPTL